MTTSDNKKLTASEKRKIKKRETILASAIEVFGKKGYTNAKMEDIANEAGVSKGTMYNYFESKESLFVELFIEEIGRSTNLEEIAEMGIPGRDKMKIFINDWFDSFDSRRYFSILILEFMLAAIHKGDGEFMQFFRSFESRRFVALTKICAQWDLECDDNYDMKAEDSATIVNSMLLGLMLQRMLGFETRPKEEYKEMIEKIFFYDEKNNKNLEIKDQ